jgi:predicted nucleotidyltransferase
MDNAIIKIDMPQEEIAIFCRRHDVYKLSVFGSVIRDDFDPEADVDVLVEFLPGQSVGFFGLAGMQVELSEIVGRKVDLKTPAELDRSFRQNVLDSAIVQYEQTEVAKNSSAKIPALQRLIQSIQS